MEKADSLSRRPDWEVGVEKDNEDETLVKPEQLEVRKTETVEIIVDKVDLLEEVRKSKVKDDEVVKAVEEIKRAGVKMLRDEEQRKIDSIIYKEGNVYVPKDDKLRTEIIRLHHDVIPYKCLGKISDNLHPNNQNNWLERRARPPQRCSLDTQSWTRAPSLSSRVVAVTTATYISQMPAQVPCIRFLMDFPSRSALEDGSDLRWVNATQVTSYLSSQQRYSQKSYDQI